MAADSVNCRKCGFLLAQRISAVLTRACPWRLSLEGRPSPRTRRDLLSRDPIINRTNDERVVPPRGRIFAIGQGGRSICEENY